MAEELLKNQTYIADVDGTSSDGAGVCRVGGRAVFVPGALRGERWEIKMTKVTAGAAWARGERRLLTSPMRITPDCPHFGKCGGCDLRHMAYEEELRFKKERVCEALRRIGGLSLPIDTIAPADLSIPARYKTIFAVGERDGEPVTGFFRPRSHDIVPVETCPAVPDAANRAAAAVRAWMRARQIRSYDEKGGREGVRHVFVRCSHMTGEIMVCLVSSLKLRTADADALAAGLRTACPELRSLVLCLNKNRGNTVLAGSFQTLYGADTITDSLCSLRFALSPQSFFQVNPPQAEKLYALALQYALTEDTKLALDLYCGAGTISLCLAKNAAHVIGAEIVPAAVENARSNAEQNGLTNAEFLSADASDAAAELARRGTTPDVVVVDPPRKGLSEAVIRAVTAMSPARVVYVSCDPGTLARDLKLFAELGYPPVRGSIVDMFPRTSHVECVVLMSRVENQP